MTTISSETNLKAEESLLAAMFFDNNNVDSTHFLLRKHFLDPFYGLVFETMSTLIKANKIADVNAVVYQLSLPTSELQDKTDLEEKINNIANALSTFQSAARQAELIYDFYLQRSLINVAQEVAEKVRSTSVYDTKRALEEATEKMFALHEPLNENQCVQINKILENVITTFEQARKREVGMSGIPSGFIDIDRLLGGFKKNDLIIIAARPSMGKTAFALTVAYYVARYLQDKQDGCVGFFSLEMSGEQLATRLASMHTGDNAKVFETGRAFSRDDGHITNKPIGDTDFARIVQTIREMSEMPLYIDATPSVSISSLRVRVRKMAHKRQLKMVIVDYLQLLRGDYNNSSNRVQEVSEISQGLKNIAKEIGVPVIALSQLSRAVESREDKRPNLADLRESGSIEQDADVVMLLYREAYYLSRSTPANPGERPTDPTLILPWEQARKKYDSHMDKLKTVENLAEIIIAKNRNGPTGNVELTFIKENTKFANHISEQEPEKEYEYNFPGRVTRIDSSPF